MFKKNKIKLPRQATPATPSLLKGNYSPLERSTHQGEVWQKTEAAQTTVYQRLQMDFPRWKNTNGVYINVIKHITLMIALLLFSNFLYAQNTLDLLNGKNTSINITNQNQEISVSEYIEKDKITLIWEVPPKFYLYKNQFKFKLINAPKAEIGTINFPEHIIKDDPNLGKQPVYYQQVVINIPIHGKITNDAKLEAYFQGCDGKICLPIQKQVFDIASVQPSSAQNIIETESNRDWGFLHLLTFLGLGILLSFTPCILPMIPIISGVVIGANTKKRSQNFLLALSYVLGMAITYMVIGLIVSWLGASFQALLQSPPFIITGTVIFVLLAVSMLGRINLQLPNYIRMKLHNAQEKQKHGSIIGAFIMGIIATAVVSPCTSAPLIGILSYTAQTGDHLYGAVSLFTLAIGMGIPLIIIATGFTWLIPKTGNWMVHVKNLFGILMLGVAIWLLSRIITEIQTQFLVSILITLSALVYWLSSLKIRKKKLNIFIRSISMITLAYGICLFIGTMLGHKSYFSPLSFTPPKPITVQSNAPYIEVDNQEALNQAIYEAEMNHKTILLDFYASWCSECHQLERILIEATTQKQLKNNSIQVIKVNVSKYSEESNALLHQYQVLGLPTIILLKNNDKTLKSRSGNITKKEIFELIRKNYD